MRKASYDMQRVICPNASCIGYSSNVAKPGYWIEYASAMADPESPGYHSAGPNGDRHMGRVLGRIAETDRDGKDCAGWLAVMTLHCELTSAGVRWVNPKLVTAAYEKPPAALLAWITGAEWVKSKHDIARMIAMAQHGTTSEQFIATRDDPEKAYNARPEYIAQFIL